MPVDTTFDSHDLVGKGTSHPEQGRMGDSHSLCVRDEMLECAFIGRIHELCAIDALLALAFLHKKVITTVTIEREFSASSTSDSLLCAAMGLEFRHTVTKV